MKVTCIIPARAGSKRIRDKNLRTVGGVSLVGRAVFSARDFIRLDGLSNARVVVDTDSEEIAQEGRAWGAEVPFLRSASLATDTASSAESSLALLERLYGDVSDSDVVILLQPTSPLRSPGDIRQCFQRFLGAAGKKAIATVVADGGAGHVVEIDGSGTIARLAKSGAEEGDRKRSKQHRLSGSVYVITAGLPRKTGTLVPAGQTDAL